VRIPTQAGRVFQREGGHFLGDDWNRWPGWIGEVVALGNLR